ncbi:uncharacterized protein LOC128233004 isoform X2 [Mya arenaria]|uniref:uncharacterized protein LOC128233004 isoform X2 n=1 Tax=Mya arenaria TaxID=6604 RepID=UPI0022DF2582|nr:uncharacterized protein LOC128233004 isoform X2 [Mya arenaria]
MKGRYSMFTISASVFCTCFTHLHSKTDAARMRIGCMCQAPDIWNGLNEELLSSEELDKDSCENDLHQGKTSSYKRQHEEDNGAGDNILKKKGIFLRKLSFRKKSSKSKRKKTSHDEIPELVTDTDEGQRVEEDVEEFDTRYCFDESEIGQWKGMIKAHYAKKDARPKCMGCGKRFNVKRRPFHCRRCGDVFCQKCVSYKRKLNRLARPDPSGKLRKVCKLCFDEDALTDGCTRSLTPEFERERTVARYARVITQRVEALTNTFWRDELDIRGECERLLSGFQKSVCLSEARKVIHDLRGAIKTPDWQKSRSWLVEKQNGQCRKCKCSLGVHRSMASCRVCGLAQCRKCSHRELLLYYPDDRLEAPDATPCMAVINVVGSPAVEPTISLLLYICGECREYICQQQKQRIDWLCDVNTNNVMETLIAMDTVFNFLTENIMSNLSNFQTKVETWLSNGKTQANRTHLDSLSAKFAAYEKHFKDLKSLQHKVDSPMQKTLLRNYTKAKYDVFMESRHTFRKLQNKLEWK